MTTARGVTVQKASVNWTCCCNARHKLTVLHWTTIAASLNWLYRIELALPRRRLSGDVASKDVAHRDLLLLEASTFRKTSLLRRRRSIIDDALLRRRRSLMRRSSRLTTARCVAFLTWLSQRRRRSACCYTQRRRSTPISTLRPMQLNWLRRPTAAAFIGSRLGLLQALRARPAARTIRPAVSIVWRQRTAYWLTVTTVMYD